MKFRFLLLTLLALFSTTAFSQSLFSINGTVKNDKAEPIESATVFLSGSTQVTKTNTNGKFSFGGLTPGTYEVVVRMLGYSSLKENAVINSQSLDKVLVLSQNNIQLNEVVIGKGTSRDKQLAMFFDAFVGVTRNAAFCNILNPEVIEFSTNGAFLKAFSNEFIVVENKSLGYKISYLLRDFSFDRMSETTIYDGESIFENLKGNESQQRRWSKNRLRAYKGSFMHYLRSLYKGNSASEGFLTYRIDATQNPAAENFIDVKQYLSKADANFAQFQFDTQLKIIYAGKAKRPGVILKDIDPARLAFMPISYVTLFVDKAVIDKKGSYLDYKSFRLEGRWGIVRLGDQLPFEYIPK
ncbi:carboxypeptidase-like regulatory domain-containing protein [Pedobacter sp. JCM 36344]|uniref:carboxypeptidase-like regulatory domain-containing protein n=1 Tax=Pedobacter sp. JCM 36344 TaxID=3374280 RepID=UPI00397A91C0